MDNKKFIEKSKMLMKKIQKTLMINSIEILIELDLRNLNRKISNL